MQKPYHIAIIYNEPTIETANGREYAINAGVNHGHSGMWVSAAKADGKIDLSEVGVLEEKEDIQAALRAIGYKTSIFNMSDDLNRFLDYLKEMKPDVIFNMVESLGDSAIHEMHIAGVYELLGISYTGSGPWTLGTCLNKARTKEVLLQNGISTARFMLVRDVGQLVADDFLLSFPIIVKPSAEDASIGIDNKSIVNTFAELKEQVAMIIEEFDEPALIEEYIEGRELNVAILGNTPPMVLPISEIDFSKLPEGYPKIVTYEAKWMDGTAEYQGTQGICPAQLSTEVEREVKDVALRAFTLMGCRDYARVDIRLSKNMKPFVLEVNPNPDLSDDAGYFRSARTYGLTYADAIGKIVGFAVERHMEKKK